MGRDAARTCSRRNGRRRHNQKLCTLPRLCQRPVNDRPAIHNRGRVAARAISAGYQSGDRRGDRSLRLYDDRANRQFPAMVGRRLWLLCGVQLGIGTTRQRSRNVHTDLGNASLHLHDVRLRPCCTGRLCARVLVRTLCRNSAEIAKGTIGFDSRRQRRAERLHRSYRRRRGCRYTTQNKSRWTNYGRDVWRSSASDSDLDRLYNRERDFVLCDAVSGRNVRRDRFGRGSRHHPRPRFAPDARYRDSGVFPWHNARRALVRSLYGRADFGPCWHDG